VLVSDIPENCEAIEGADFTFRRGDAHDLERMLQLLLSEPAIRKAAANRGRERVQRHYRWDQIAREVAIYAELAPGEDIPGAARVTDRHAA
jgi:glycosyltransferase involved in cell wall biosynthesis